MYEALIQLKKQNPRHEVVILFRDLDIESVRETFTLRFLGELKPHQELNPAEVRTIFRNFTSALRQALKSAD
jgi:hypothetical protein